MLLQPGWQDDDNAAVLARRDPINDGFHTPDGYVWLDHLGRAAATTENSYQIRRSRLAAVDVKDRGVAGFSRWFEREVAHRSGLEI